MQWKVVLSSYGLARNEGVQAPSLQCRRGNGRGFSVDRSRLMIAASLSVARREVTHERREGLTSRFGHGVVN